MRILKQCLFSAFFTLSILSLAACGGSSNNHSGPANNPGNTNPGGNPGNPDGDGGNSGDGNSDGGDDNDGTTGTFSLAVTDAPADNADHVRSEEHTSELQSRGHLVCRLRRERKEHTDEQS